MTSTKNTARLLRAYNSFADGKIPDCHELFKNMFELHEEGDLYADVFALMRMADYFKKREEFFRVTQEECDKQIEDMREEQSPFLLDCDKEKERFKKAEELFKSKNKFQDIKTDLQIVSKQQVGSDSDGFIKARINEAETGLEQFKKDVQKIIDESFDKKNYAKDDLIFQANSKTYARVVEKVKEMKADKYEEPVEKSLQDLLRGRFLINPSRVREDNVEETIKDIVTFLENLDKDIKVIRIKNKLSSLGNISLNMTYKTLIVELQICFGWDYKCFYESHVVYDLKRLISFGSLHNYFMDKKVIKEASEKFKKSDKKAIGGVNKIDEDDKGAKEYVSLIIKLFSNPDAHSFDS